jgi:phosphoglycerate dehydrogenase-like enzyme
MQKLNILYEGQIPKTIRKELCLLLPEGFELEFSSDKTTKDERAESLQKAHFLMGFPGPISADELETATSVKLVQLLSAGYELFDVERATQLGIPVANNGGANSIAVAEHTILFILALYKKLCKHHNGLLNGIWVREKDHPLGLFELAGKQVGIVGFGNVGKALAKRLLAFETTINYYDVIRYRKAEKKLSAKYLALEELLKRSDIVTLHLPLLETTRGIIGERQFALMKSSAILINTSRGGIIDEQALYEALKSGKIAGAGLDVFLRQDDMQKGKCVSPLFGLENVVVTPHYAGHTYDTWFRRIKIGYENIVRTAEGKKPRYVINKEVLGRTARSTSSVWTACRLSAGSKASKHSKYSNTLTEEHPHHNPEVQNAEKV